MNSSHRLLKRIFVTLACLGMATIASYFLYLDFMDSNDVKPGSGIAQIKKSHNSVKRRAAKSFLWKKADQGQELQLKDSIQTADDSAAAITLNSGQLIELGANSLFVLNDSKDLSLGFLQGTVVVGENGQSFKFETDPKTGETRKVVLPASLQEPAPFKDFFSKEDRFTVKMKIAWSAAEVPSANTLVQVSQSKDFSKFESWPLQKVKDNIYEATAEVAGSGEWHWRLAGASKILSQERSFKTQKTFVLQGTYPRASDVVLSVQKETKVSFAWRPYKGAVSKDVAHQIEISSDVDFKKIHSTATVDPAVGNSQLGPLSYGKYYWRIVGSFESLKEASLVQDFIVKPKNDFVVALEAPLNESVHTVEKGESLDLTWSTEESFPDLTYVVELSYTDTNSKTQVIKREAPTNRLTLKSTPWGRYSWKVLSMSKEAKIGESRSSTFYSVSGRALEIESPKNKAPVYYWKTKIPLALKWKNPGSSPSKYQVQISQFADLSQIVKKEDTRNKQLKVEGLNVEGAFYWRVVGLDSDNNLVSASPIEEFSYGLHPPLTVALTQIYQDSRRLASVSSDKILSFNIMEDSQALTVLLPRQEEQTSGVFRLYRGKTTAGGTALLKKQSEEKTLTLPNLKPGFYAATFQPIDVLNRPGIESDPLVFEVTLGEPLPAPRVLSSEVQ